MVIPQSDILTTNRLGKIFSNTTATYKFFWFVSIMQIKRLLNTLTLNVPYRFLRPWIDTSDDKEMVRRSQTLENGSLYALYKDGSDFYIVLNQAWDAYLHTHYNILVDFAGRWDRFLYRIRLWDKSCGRAERIQ